jgi:DNA-directed RNA polymerase specialized sigma24 family protein
VAKTRAGNDSAPEQVMLQRALLLLTEEERLVLIWKKAGFSDREIAKHLSRPASAVRDVYRRGVSKIQLSRDVTLGTTAADDDLP